MRNKFLKILTSTAVIAATSISLNSYNVKALEKNNLGDAKISKEYNNQFKYNSIEKVRNDVRNNIPLEQIIKETNDYINLTNPKFKYIIKTPQTNKQFESYIQNRIKYLNSIKTRNIYSKMPLFGVPVIVKDNVDVKTISTTGGSKYFINNVADENSDIVKKLHSLGAIIVAKATMSEFAGAVHGEGQTEIMGQPVNPINSSFQVTGSSTGSAIASTLGFPLTIGTETYGSGIIPATIMQTNAIKYNNKMSIKGIMPLNNDLDSVVLMSSNNKDLMNIDKLLTNKVESNVAPKVKVASEVHKTNTPMLSNIDNEKYKYIAEQTNNVLNKNNINSQLKSVNDIKSSPSITDSYIMNNVYSKIKKELKTSFSSYKTKNGENLSGYYNHLKSINALESRSLFSRSFSYSSYIDNYTNKRINMNSQVFSDNDIWIEDSLLGVNFASVQSKTVVMPFSNNNGKVMSLAISSKYGNEDKLYSVIKSIRNNLSNYKFSHINQNNVNQPKIQEKQDAIKKIQSLLGLTQQQKDNIITKINSNSITPTEAIKEAKLAQSTAQSNAQNVANAQKNKAKADAIKQIQAMSDLKQGQKDIIISQINNNHLTPAKAITLAQNQASQNKVQAQNSNQNNTQTAANTQNNAKQNNSQAVANAQNNVNQSNSHQQKVNNHKKGWGHNAAGKWIWYTGKGQELYNKPGWQKWKGSWLFENKDRTYATSEWKKVSGKWYHFSKDAYINRGWRKISGKWYHFSWSGKMDTKGWHKISGKWYYMNKGGDLYTKKGWWKTHGKWMYSKGANGYATSERMGKYSFDSNGYMK